MHNRAQNIRSVLLLSKFVFGIAFFFTLSYSNVVHAAYEKFSAGSTATIGEFVYEDDFTPSSEDCILSIYSPSGSTEVNAATMDEEANGWHFYEYAVPSSGPEGIWPAFMSCGTALDGDLVKMDKTFSVGAVNVSSTTIATAVWNSSTRTLSSFGSLVSTIWSNATRTLTGATLDSGSLATQSDVTSASSSLNAAISASTATINTNTDSEILNASTSLASNINANTNSATAGITSAVNANTNSAIATASSSLFATLPGAIWSYSARTLTSFGTLVANVWSNATRTLTGATLDSGSLATQANITTASSSLGAAITGGVATVNSNTNNAVLAASTSLASNINQNTDSEAANITSTVNANTNAVVQSASSSLFASLPGAIWSYSARTLTSFGTLVTNVWSNATRTLTGATLDSGSLATQSDVTSASSSLNAAISASTATINTNTDSEILNASTSLASNINANTNSATAGITSAVNANTDSEIAAASTSLAASINANTNNAIASASTSLAAAISAGTADINAEIQSASSSLATGILTNRALINSLNDISAADVWSAGTRTLTAYGTSTGASASSTATAVWNMASAQLTSVGSIGKLLADNIDAEISSRGTSSLTAAEVWAAGTRTLSDYNTSALSTAVTTAVWANAARTLTNYGNDITAAQVWDALTSGLTSVDSIGKLLVDNVNTTVSSRASLANQTAGWTITMSDYSSVQAGETYRARIEVRNSNSVPTAPFDTPNVTLYDAERNITVSAVDMTSVATGVYEYTYAVSDSASQGVWETIVSTEVESGKTLTNNDYWIVAGSPAQVIINSVTGEIPTATANVTITNEGLAGYEYQYEWCVVSASNNQCGGGDDVYHATGAKFINPSEDWNTNLTATVSSAGSYYFKLIVYFGTDRSGSSRTFIFEGDEEDPPPQGGGGGGKSGGGSASVSAPRSCVGANFNGDRITNSIDFSILLSYWKLPPPATNKCVDISGDNIINSVDFSILLSQWGTKGSAL